VISSSQAKSAAVQEGSVLAVLRRELMRDSAHEAQSHARHQLLWPPSSVLAVRTAENDWIVTPTTGLWVPAGVVHSARVRRSGDGYVVYVEPVGCPVDWEVPTGFVVGPLMRELIVYLGGDRLDVDHRRRAEAVLYDLLEPAPLARLHVPLPADPRARDVADALIESPDDPRNLGAWGLEVGASLRTLARLFAAETGMTFAQWRAQVRMRAAIGLLAEGVPVTTVARRVGYTSPSAFVAAFRRLTGHTPGESTFS
jgi:AraC-like DNA-binding protein